MKKKDSKVDYVGQVIDFISELERLELFSMQLKEGIASKILRGEDRIARVEFLVCLHNEILENEEISEKNKIKLLANFSGMFSIAINE